ncbi:tetrapyrrole methylase, partial [Exidia glandulosa HHB12029]
ARAFAALESGAAVLVFAPAGQDSICDELKWRAAQGQLELRVLGDNEDEHDALERVFASSAPRLVCVTDTLRTLEHARSKSSAEWIKRLCARLGVPLNVADMPELCDFTFLATHRAGTHVQLGVTTNGHGCRLAGRIKRELVAALPRDADRAVQNVSRLRVLSKAQGPLEDDEAEAEGVAADVNAPVPQRNAVQETDVDAAKRRMRWIAQVSEYWPIPKLAALTESDMVSLLSDPAPTLQPVSGTVHDFAPAHGRIYLVGSGPGHPGLLTRAAHSLLTSSSTHAVLSDKLVPQSIISLIPPHIELHIARKFPGNADNAQAELLNTAIDLLQRGKTVVRLKQGDPALFGRAGEEVLALRAAGFPPVLVPGVSAALAAPLLASPAIPVTQRGVADALAVCTGVGRGGKGASVPGYERSRTTCVLMAAARVGALCEAMLAPECSRRSGDAYPPHLPVALIERASMRDQRVMCTTLQDLEEAMVALGEQRPPGMLVVGWSVLCLDGEGDTTVLDCVESSEILEIDVQRVQKWLGGIRWKVVEGLDAAWDSL